MNGGTSGKRELDRDLVEPPAQTHQHDQRGCAGVERALALSVAVVVEAMQETPRVRDAP